MRPSRQVVDRIAVAHTGQRTWDGLDAEGRRFSAKTAMQTIDTLNRAGLGLVDLACDHARVVQSNVNGVWCLDCGKRVY